MLSFFLGGLGIHKFYLGQPGLGLLYAVFCWTFVPMILGAIEGIMFLTMSDATFNERYNGVGVSSTVPAAMRKCPECAELVKAEAIRCRYCQSRLVPV
jgi:TM2 domain-containing membrane protein YozV